MSSNDLKLNLKLKRKKIEMCVISSAIIELESMKDDEFKSMRDLWERISGKSFELNEAGEAFGCIDYLQTHHMFKPEENTNTFIMKNPNAYNRKNAITMLTMWKMFGIVSWEMIDRFKINSENVTKNVIDLKEAIDKKNQKRKYTKIVEGIMKSVSF